METIKLRENKKNPAKIIQNLKWVNLFNYLNIVKHVIKNCINLKQAKMHTKGTAIHVIRGHKQLIMTKIKINIV